MAKFNSIFDHVIPKQKTRDLLTVVALFLSLRGGREGRWAGMELGSERNDRETGWTCHPTGGSYKQCLFVCLTCKEMFGNIEET